MSRLFFGSSNVYRSFTRSTLAQDLSLNLVECTRKIVFDTHLRSLSNLGPGSLVVSSVLENFVVDAVRDLAPDKVGLFANQSITAHVEALASLVRDNVGVLAIISPLLCRQVPSTYRSLFPMLF